MVLSWIYECSLLLTSQNSEVLAVGSISNKSIYNERVFVAVYRYWRANIQAKAISLFLIFLKASANMKVEDPAENAAPENVPQLPFLQEVPTNCSRVYRTYL